MKCGVSAFNTHFIRIAKLRIGELRKPYGTYTRTCSRFRAGMERRELYPM